MEIKIKSKRISATSPVFIIAELSANHNQDFALAVKTIKAIKRAGADAVKIQTYTADTITIDSDKKYFKVNQGTIWDGTTLHQLYSQAYTPWEWQPKLKKVAEDLGLIFFSTPFDFSAVDFLKKMNMPAYKIASFEITDHALIKYTAKCGKPMIISTGVSNLQDIEDAVAICKKVKNNQIALLKCTSSYPAPYEEMNLMTIPDMAKRFKTIVGLSDHTEDSSAAIAAVALGAKIIEKHFILDRKIGGPDAAFSMEPDEFARMVRDIRNVEQALGKATYTLSAKAKKSRDFARSLFVVADIKKGEKFTDQNVRSIRPNFGLHPKHLNQIIGRSAAKDIERGEPLSLKDVVK